MLFSMIVVMIMRVRVRRRVAASRRRGVRGEARGELHVIMSSSGAAREQVLHFTLEGAHVGNLVAIRSNM